MSLLPCPPSNRCRRIAATAALLLAAACGPGAKESADTIAAGSPADLILHGGPIVTLAGDGEAAGAVAIRDGAIIAVGDGRDIVAAHEGPDTELRDLGGATLLPGFIDAHGHFMQVGFLAQSAHLLPPPDGGVTDFDSMAEKLLAHRASAQARQMGWIVGMGYDDAQLAERRHPTATDLDGMIDDLPLPQDAQNVAAMILAGQASYAAAGFTTVQEGRASPANVAAIRGAADKGLLKVDVDVYPDPTFAADDETFDAIMAGASLDYENHFRIPGIKLSLDGSPQAKTAWLSMPYHVPPEGQEESYRGYPQLEDDFVREQILRAFERGWQVLTHVNGDAAIDQFLAAVDYATDRLGEADRRPVAIHAQTAREDQLDAMAKLGVIPSFMSVHTYYWGDWHRNSVLGPERAARISPAASALERGIAWTSHNDAPVTPPNSRMILYSQVNRITRSGRVLGPEQRVAPRQALEAITINAARQLFEESRKGTIEAGKLADFVIVDRNPLSVPPEELDDLQILETIKEGATIWRAGS